MVLRTVAAVEVLQKQSLRKVMNKLRRYQPVDVGATGNRFVALGAVPNSNALALHRFLKIISTQSNGTTKVQFPIMGKADTPIFNIKILKLDQQCRVIVDYNDYMHSGSSSEQKGN